MVPATAVLSYFLLGIKELAIQLEEPFSVLPLESMAAGIEVSIMEALTCAEERYELPNPYTMELKNSQHYD